MKNAGMVIVLMAMLLLSGCFSMFTCYCGGWNGGPSTGSRIVAGTLDVATAPVQLVVFGPFLLGEGISSLVQSAEERNWRKDREKALETAKASPFGQWMQRPDAGGFSWRGSRYGLVYADESIPLSERFMVSHVLQCLAVDRIYAFGGENDLVALLSRGDWTSDALRSLAPQIRMNRNREVREAYLSNPKTPPDVVAAFRDRAASVRMVRPDTADCLERWFGSPCAAQAKWSIGGGMWDLCAVGTLDAPADVSCGAARGHVVQVYGYRRNDPAGEWKGDEPFGGAVGAVVIEFENVGQRDEFLQALVPTCRYSDNAFWTQLAYESADGSLRGVCLEREQKPLNAPVRIFVIDLGLDEQVRFWPPREYGEHHIWAADCDHYGR